MSGRLEHKGPCTSHRLYHLTCDELAVLLAVYGDRCAICTISGPETKHGYLVIDHDRKRGYWAVRGMLCVACNSRIRDDRFVSPAEKAYAADPWWRRRLAQRGLSAEMLPEPAIGSVVSGRKHQWRRTEYGWEIDSRNLRGGPYSWRGLNQVLGPYNIRIIREGRAAA